MSVETNSPALPEAQPMTNALANVETMPWWMAGWSRSITPSSLGRAAACIRSEAMPHAYEESPFARKGTVGHKFLADCLEHGRDLALGMVEDPADIEWLAMLPLERLPAFHPQSYAPEVALAYDPKTRTCRELGRNISREEAHRRKKHDWEIVGILDICGQTAFSAVVHDYKLGWGYVEPAEVNWQLRTYGLMAARWLQLNECDYSVIRARDNGQTWSDVAHMDELDLLAHEEALADLLERRESIRAITRAGQWEKLPALVEGRHCRYCPAKFACPAKVAGVVQVVREPQEVLPANLTPELAASAWRKIRAAQKTLERFEAVIREYARTEPVPLGDGEWLAEKATPKETIVPERAREALVRQYGQLGTAVYGEASETETSITKKAFRAALKKLVLPTLPPDHQKITWLERDALKLLREAGAISVVVTKCVTEHVPPKLDPALGLPEGTEEAA